jgi:hypothetical protein
MPPTIFISQLLGPVLMLIGLHFVINKSWYVKMKKSNYETIVRLIGFAELPVGIAIVLNHNVWEFTSAGIITTFGWLMILEGSMELLLPPKKVQEIKAIMATRWVESFSFIIFVLGCYFTLRGYGIIEF